MAALIACTINCGMGQLAVAQTPAASPILVELFTSEGCSSCPPADAQLQQMDAAQFLGDAQLIVLSEHVDYWNHDGWKDPYSAPLFTARQGDYARALGLGAPYTPQFIVDGVNELRMGDPQKMNQVFERAATAAKIPVRIVSARVDAKAPGKLRGHVEADGGSMNHNASVYLAVARNHAESQVLGGENSGRHLNHVAVVQELEKIGTLKKGQKFSRDFQVDMKRGTDPGNVRVIVFVQEPATGKVVGAALQRKIS
jgi:hypothetical protein